jgi:excisionase family DNA binding protein
MNSSRRLPGWIPPRLLTVEETAELLQLSIRHVRRLIADGRLEVKRIGRATRVTPEGIAALLDLK